MLQNLTILVMGMAAGLFGLSSCLYLMNVRHKRINAVLGVILGLYALYIAKDVLYFTEMVNASPYLYRILLSVDNWAVPLYVIYAFEILSPGKMTLAKDVLLLLPFILLSALYAIFPYDWVYSILIYFSSFYSAFFILLILFMTVKYRKVLVDNRSDITHMDIRWMWASIALLVPNLILWTVLSSRLDYYLDIYYYVLLSLTWGVVAYKTYFYRPLATVEFQREAVSSGPQCHFAGKLGRLAEDGYFVRTPGLTLTELASELGTNRTTLSSYINNELHTTFYDYVNGVRVQHASRLMSDAAHRYSTEQVAGLSGFNSLSTFRRAFIKKYGVSPSQYRERALKAGKL